MTEKRFTYENHKVKDNLTGEIHSSNMVSVNVLNALHEENEELKEHFIYLIGTALEDKECRKIYAKGLLEIFDDCANLDEAKSKIKEYLE